VVMERDEMNREEAQPLGEGQELAGGAPVPLRRSTRVDVISGWLKGALRWLRPARWPYARVIAQTVGCGPSLARSVLWDRGCYDGRSGGVVRARVRSRQMTPEGGHRQ
jgi:hypothetical protein